jgi:hypothetical protein
VKAFPVFHDKRCIMHYGRISGWFLLVGTASAVLMTLLEPG